MPLTETLITQIRSADTEDAMGMIDLCRLLSDNKLRDFEAGLSDLLSGSGEELVAAAKEARIAIARVMYSCKLITKMKDINPMIKSVWEQIKLQYLDIRMRFVEQNEIPQDQRGYVNEYTNWHSTCAAMARVLWRDNMEFELDPADAPPTSSIRIKLHDPEPQDTDSGSDEPETPST